jgi:hypothetical protein
MAENEGVIENIKELTKQRDDYVLLMFNIAILHKVLAILTPLNIL